jgi:hypothetical protein
MTQEDIIRMAREADIDWHRHWNDDESNRLERFAALVAAAEREECAKVCEEEICHCCWDEEAGAVAEHLAEAIRARGQA